MKQVILSTLIAVLSYPLIGQETIGAPYNPDANNDSLITVPDIMSILPLFGQEFLPSEDDLDSENEIQSLYLSGDTLYLIPAGGFILLSDLAGPQGEVGPEGPAGAPGGPGADGVGVLTTLSNSDGSFTLVFTDGTSYTSPVLIGPQGEVGPTGEMGPAGPQGETGLSGETGPAGPQGEQGPMGEVGPAGADGIGVSSVAIEYDSLLITLTSGEIQNAGSVVPALDSLFQGFSSLIGFSGCDQRFPFGYEGTPVYHVGWSEDYTVPEGYTLIINHPFQSEESLTINGYGLLYGSYNQGNGQGFSASIIAASGDDIGGQMNFAGMLFPNDDSITPVTVNLNDVGNYEVPSGMKFIWLQAKGDFSVNGVALYSSNTHWSFGQPLQLGAGDLLSLTSVGQGAPNEGTINGYLVSDSYFTNCGGSSAGGISDSNDGSLQTGVCVADLSNFSASSQEHYVVSAVECSVLIVTNSPCCVTHEVYLPEGVDGQLLKVDGDSNHSVNIVNGTGAQTLIGSLANGSLSLYWYEGAWRRL